MRTPVLNSWSQTTGRLYNRAGVLHVTSTLNKHTLAETVVWCSLQVLTSVAVETHEMRRRRDQIEEAGRILQRARSRAERSWFRRDVYKSRDWQQAMLLLEEAKPNSLAPLEGQLRSSVIEPNTPLSRSRSEVERERIVTEVINKRSQLLWAECHKFSDEQVLSESAGRLLTYSSENVADGASRYASRGYFDADDTPPWDTWVHYSDRILVCWVPAVVEPLAQAGIDADPVLCINWADSASCLMAPIRR